MSYDPPVRKLEDDASANADPGVPVLAVRKAAPANTSGTDGDYEFLQMSAGRLWCSVNIDQINGVAPLMGAGNTGTGSMRVTLATDQVAIAAWGKGATAAAVPSSAQLDGGRGATANPTPVTNGQLVAVMTDKLGRQVVVSGHVRDLVGWQRTNVAVNTETTIVTAGAAGVFRDITKIIITTAGFAAQVIDIRDATGGTVILKLNYPNAALAPGAPLVLDFNPPLKQTTAANAWTITQGLATACNIHVQYVENT